MGGHRGGVQSVDREECGLLAVGVASFQTSRPSKGVREWLFYYLIYLYHALLRSNSTTLSKFGQSTVMREFVCRFEKKAASGTPAPPYGEGVAVFKSDIRCSPRIGKAGNIDASVCEEDQERYNIL
eukprot:1151760-Pelagomonas_calceolata.AAC.16